MSVRASRADLRRLGIDVHGGIKAARKGMNATERRYAERLDVAVLAGKIVAWEFEPAALPLGYRCTYTPDFKVWTKPWEFEYHECKGLHVWEDSRIKIKWAAQKYAPVVFRFCQWRNSRWHVRAIPPE